MAKGGKARERFLKKQQYNQIVAQLNQRAAGNASPQGASPQAARPSAAPPGAPAWWQYQQQYGSQTVPVSSNPFGNVAGSAGGIVQGPGSNIPNTAYNANYYTQAAQTEEQRNFAQNPELKYNNPAWMNVNKPSSAQAPKGPMQWWQYAKQFGPIKQAPETPLDDFYFRHPDTPFTPPSTPSGGYGYGGGYGRRRRGGGGWGGYSYAPRPSYESSAPAWARGGLANWTIG